MESEQQKQEIPGVARIYRLYGTWYANATPKQQKEDDAR